MLPILLVGLPSSLMGQVAAPVSAPPPAQAAPAPLPLSIDDQRPGWERHSKDCAVDFVALENAPDPPWNFLADAVGQESRAWADPPCQATLELQSFRVVCKDQAGNRTGSFWLPPLNSSSSFHGGAGAAVFYVGVMAVVLTAEGVYALGRESVDLVCGCRRAAKGPPYTLGDEYQSGITCDIKGGLVLRWPDGRQRRSEIVGIANCGKDASGYLWDDIEAMVRTATRQLAQDWLRQNSLGVAVP
jgi:hypothetical protein